MNKNELKTILEKHELWLSNKDGEERANLSWADPRWVQHELDTTHRICTKSILPTEGMKFATTMIAILSIASVKP